MPKFKILAIDDNPPGLELVLSALEQEGVDIVGASDPEEGLRIYRRDRPEVVLLDLMMPKMNGIEVLKEIVRPEPGGHRSEIPTLVIMLTAFGTV